MRNIIGRVLLEGHCPKASFGEHGRKRYDTMNSYFLCQCFPRVLSESLHPDDISGTPLKINMFKPSFSKQVIFRFPAVQIFQSETRFFFLMHESRLSKKRDPSSSPKPGEDQGASLTCRGFSCFPAQGHLTVKAPSESDISIRGFPDGDVMCFFPQTKSSGRNSWFSGTSPIFFWFDMFFL